MVLAKTNISAFGWKAPDFVLKGVDGKTYSFADVRGPKGTLVAFICNHCPYVRAVIGRLVAEANALREIGIGTIAIMPNDTAAYAEDSFDNMQAFAAQHGFTFPYVIDATQDVAGLAADLPRAPPRHEDTGRREQNDCNHRAERTNPDQERDDAEESRGRGTRCRGAAGLGGEPIAARGLNGAHECRQNGARR